MSLFSRSGIAGMRDWSAARNHCPERDAFRREHERHRAWGLRRRHAAKLRHLRQNRPEQPAVPTARSDPPPSASLARQTPTLQTPTRAGTIPATRHPGPTGPNPAETTRAATASASRHPGPATTHPNPWRTTRTSTIPRDLAGGGDPGRAPTKCSPASHRPRQSRLCRVRLGRCGCARYSRRRCGAGLPRSSQRAHQRRLRGVTRNAQARCPARRFRSCGDRGGCGGRPSGGSRHDVGDGAPATSRRASRVRPAAAAGRTFLNLLGHRGVVVAVTLGAV